MKESERYIASVTAALEILSVFERDVPLRLKELHERTGQNRSRLLRLLGTLEKHGYVQSNPQDGTYVLGGVLYRLGSLLAERFSRVEIQVRPVLKRLVEDTGDTAFYSSIEGTHRVVLVAEESQDALRFTAREGQTRPLHLGATSKLLLAFADDDTKQRAFEAVDEADQQSLVVSLAQIAARGYAVSQGEVTPHGFAIAVPVRREGGRVDAVSLAGVLGKLRPDLVEHHVDRLRRDASSLERAFGFSSAA